MKKTLALLLALLFLLPAGGTALAAEAADGAVEISDLAGLRAIADAPDGSYRLTADIDMAGEDWTPIAFSGKLDGDGHTLYNLRVTRVGEEVRTTKDGNLKSYDTVFAGLFSVLENAEIRNLTLTGATLSVQGETHCFAGLLAGYMDHSTLEDCAVQGRGKLVNYAVQTGIGGLAGYGSGDIRRCSADVELVFEDKNLDKRCEQFMGGVLSCGIANIEDCSVVIDGYDSCHGYVHNGGLVGMYYYCGISFRGNNVMRNSVKGRIRFFEANPDRRAYCAPYLGEPLSKPGNYAENTNEFERDETKDYSTVLLPEQCEMPEIHDTVTPPDCTHWGWVDHACAGCGYSWRDSYFAPQHTPGEWVTVREATETEDGLRERYCEVCGELLDSESVAWQPPEPEPTETPAEEALVHGVESTEELGVRFRGRAQAMHSQQAKEPLRWSSDDTRIATVDENGVIRGVSRGTTTVRYVSDDGLCSGVCLVTVEYSLWQWFLILFCFGWFWYA